MDDKKALALLGAGVIASGALLYNMNKADDYKVFCHDGELTRTFEGFDTKGDGIDSLVVTTEGAGFDGLHQRLNSKTYTEKDNAELIKRFRNALNTYNSEVSGRDRVSQDHKYEVARADACNDLGYK